MVKLDQWTRGQGSSDVVSSSLGCHFPRRRPEYWARPSNDLDKNFNHFSMFLSIHGNRLIYFHVWVRLKGKGLLEAQQDGWHAQECGQRGSIVRKTALSPVFPATVLRDRSASV